MNNKIPQRRNPARNRRKLTMPERRRNFAIRTQPPNGSRRRGYFALCLAFALLFLLHGRTLLLADDVRNTTDISMVNTSSAGIVVAQGTTVDDQDLDISEEQRNGTRPAPNGLTLDEIRALFKQLDQLFAARAAKTELLNCSLDPHSPSVIESHLDSIRLQIESARQADPIDPGTETKRQSLLSLLKAAGDRLLGLMERLEVLAEHSKLQRSSKCAELAGDTTPANADEIRREMAKVQDLADAELARVRKILSAFSALAVRLAELSEPGAEALATLEVMRQQLNEVNGMIRDAAGVISKNDTLLSVLLAVRGEIDEVLGKLDAALRIMSEASPPIAAYGGLERSLAAYRVKSTVRAAAKDVCPNSKTTVAKLSQNFEGVRTLIDDYAVDVNDAVRAAMSNRQADASRSYQGFKSADYLVKAEMHVRQISDASGKIEQCIADIQRTACNGLQHEFDAAAALIDRGVFGAADKALQEIDAKSCPALVPGIADERARISRLVDKTIAEAESASKTCDADTMGAAISRLEKSSHPRFAGILDRKLIAEAAAYFAHSRFEAAQRQYAGGDFAASIATLKSARSALDKAGGDVTCNDLVKRITAGISRAERLDAARGKIDAAMASCDAVKIAAYARQMKSLGKSHPLMRSRIAELDAIKGSAGEANRLYQAAKAPYADGDISAAREHLAKGRVVLSAFGSSKCADQRIKISKALDKIQRLETALARADAAIENCSLSEIANWWGKFEAHLSHPLIGAKIPALRQAHESCGRLEDGGGFAEEKNVRDARCRSKHGPGNHAGPVDAQGKYYCLPIKKKANAWCRENKRGPGWYAGEINAWGGFKCRQSVEGQKVTAMARCQQYRKPGERLKRVYRNSGKWWCQWQTAKRPTANKNRKPTQIKTQGNCPEGHAVWGGKCVNVKALRDALVPVGNICAGGVC